MFGPTELSSEIGRMLPAMRKSPADPMWLGLVTTVENYGIHDADSALVRYPIMCLIGVHVSSGGEARSDGNASGRSGLVHQPMTRLRQRPVKRPGAALHAGQQCGAQPLLVELLRHLGRIGATGQLAV